MVAVRIRRMHLSSFNRLSEAHLGILCPLAINLICIANNQILANPRRIVLGGLCHEGVDGSIAGGQNRSDDLPSQGCKLIAITGGNLADEVMGP